MELGWVCSSAVGSTLMGVQISAGFLRASRPSIHRILTSQFFSLFMVQQLHFRSLKGYVTAALGNKPLPGY
jgi:hypothetical protein